MCKRVLNRKRQDAFNMKGEKDLRIMLSVLVLRSLPATLISIVSSLSLGKVICVRTLDTCLMFSLVTLQGKNQV